MIFELDEQHYLYANTNNLTIVGESNTGDKFLIQADDCDVEYVESYPDSELENLLNEEPYVQANEDIE